MSNYDRGYEPPQDDRVFDAADDDEEEEGSRLPLLIVIALLVLAAFAGVVWLAYSQGVARGRGDTGAAVAQQDTGTPAAGDVVKPYEQPAPADEDADNSNTAPAVADDESASSPPAAEQQAVVAPPVSPPPAVKPAQTAVTTPAPAAAKPVVRPPAQVVAAKPAAAPPAAQRPVAAATGGIALQIGAYKSQAEADSAWAAYKGKHASLVSSYSSSTVKVDLGAKGTWYRLRIGPFQTRADATTLCTKLQADGASCFLAK